MAQIIKHRRGNLEGLKDATTRAGELLVVTGSSGLGTIANGADLVFVGIDGSTASPVNKILQGTTVPDLTGGNYNTHVDGIPFFDTDDQKLYILNKGGNVEVKATPQTGGTGIVSGSAQLANSTVSNESLNAATGSYLTGTIDISSGTNLAVSDTTEVNMILTGDTISAELIGGVVSGSAQISGVTNTQLAGSIANAKLANSAITISGTSVSLGGAITDETLFGGTGVVTGSAQITNIANSQLAGSIANGKLANSAITISGTSVSLGGAITDEVLFGGTGVISGSAQLLNVATDFGSGRLSGASIGDLAGTSTITGSFVGNGAGLTGLATNLTVDGDSGTQNVDLIADDLQFLGTANEIVTAVTKDGTDVKVTISLPDDITVGGDLVVTGDMQVSGTTTTVDSTTVQISDNILELNGAGAANGGLHIKDATGSTTTTGSIIYDTTNDVWKAGAKDSEIEIADISGAQTFTNKTINASQLVNSSVANGKLANSAITISGTSVSLGGAITDEVLFGGTGVVTGSAQVTGIGNGQLSNSAVTISGTSVSLGGAITDETLFGGTGVVTGSAQITGVTNTQLAGSIANDKLSNSAVTISGTSVSLGGAITDEVLFGGTGVISGSAQLANSTVSNESLNAATGSYLTGTVDISSQTNLAVSDTTEVNMILTGDTISAELIGGVVSGSAQITGVTNSQLAGSIANGKLANSAVTISGTSVSLGGAITDEVLFGGVGVVTGSAQIVAGLSNQATDFGSGRVSGDSIGDVGGTTTFTGSFVGNGANLTGLATNLTIGADNGSDDTVALTTGTLNFVGTSNEIETTVSNDQIQIGIPTNPTLTGNVTVTGNLNVEGTTTTIDSTTVNIGDRIIELNYARGAGDAGLLVSDVDGATTVSGSLLWDASADHWMAGGLGSEKEIARLNASPTSNTVLKANASGLLVDTNIADDGTNVTIGGSAELRINAATANSFVYFDANKSIEAVAASTAGDVIQWNGSSFVASNEIDGGTF